MTRLKSGRSSSTGCLSAAAPFVIFIVLWWIIAANISDTRAPRTAEAYGLTDVTVTSSTIWFTGFKGCGYGDMKEWYVTGTNAYGKRVSVIICGGLFKGNTMRVR